MCTQCDSNKNGKSCTLDVTERTGVANLYEIDHFYRDVVGKCKSVGVACSEKIPAIAPVSQTDFGGKIVCGIRGGDSFSKV